jgi:uncharacterized membrane-anchored protein YhcB (DUF1043 family)/DNA-binding transcriptional regulator YdaS (Cro superfamily)
MPNAAPIRVDIIGNSRGLNTMLDGASNKLNAMSLTAARASAATDKLERSMNRLNAVAGIGAAAIGAGFVLKNLADAAGAAQTATQSMNSVFRSTAGQMQAAAKAGESVGLSFAGYGQQATRLGAQLQNMGFDAQGAADTTQLLIRQGADLAATFGGSTTQALEAMSAVFRKEMDPIEKYGVTMKAAAIDTLAAEQGISYGQAAIQAIMSQTGYATGAFNRNADTYNVQMQKMAAATENAKASLGRGLLPMFTVLSSAVTPVAKGIGAIPAPLMQVAVSAGAAYSGWRLLNTAIDAGTAKLEDYAAAQKRSMNVPQNVATAGLNTVKGGMAESLARNLNKVATAGVAAGVAIATFQIYMDKTVASMVSITQTAEEMTLVLSEATNRFTDYQVQVGKPLLDPFEPTSKSLQELLPLLDRSKFEATVDFLTGLGTSVGEEAAVTQYLQSTAAAIKAIQESDPELAARRTSELFQALTASGLPAERINEIMGDLGLNIGQSAQAASDAAALYGNLEAALKGVADAKSQMDMAFAGQDKIAENAKNQDAYRQAVEESNEAAKKGQNALRGWSSEAVAAGRASKSADEATRGAANSLIEQAQSGRKAALSMGEVTGSAKVVAAQTRQARASFIESATAMGLSRTEARQLATALGLVPEEVKTVYKQSGAAKAKAEADAVRQSVVNIPSYKEIQIVVKKGLAVPGQVGPAFDQGRPRDLQTYADQLSGRSGGALRGTTTAGWEQYGSSIAASIFRGLDKGFTRNVLWTGEVDFSKVEKKIEPLFDKTTKKGKETWDKITEKWGNVVGRWEGKYNDLYDKLEKREDRLRDLQEKRRDFIANVADQVSAFSISDAVAETKTVTKSWDHLVPILREMRETTDPARLAELRAQYAAAVQAGPKEAEVVVKSIGEKLREQLLKTQQFAANLQTLKTRLDPRQIQALVDAGAEAGGEMAAALVADPALLKTYKETYDDMAKASRDIGVSLVPPKLTSDIAQVKRDVRESKKELVDFWKDFKEAAPGKLGDWELKVKVIWPDGTTTGGKNPGKGANKSSAQGTPVIGTLVINGAVDPEGTARSVNRVLNQHARRTGV